MIAFIFNSGTGKRLNQLTQDKPKALIRLNSGETLLARQVRFLKQAGINKIILSTGPFENQLKEETKKFRDISFHFVHNPKFDSTNNIYSLFLAKDFLKEDALILHGDLVFDRKLIPSIIKNSSSNFTLINQKIPLPRKDFKGVIQDSKISHISVNTFSSNSFALQPIFKLSKEMILKWLQSCENFINDGKINHYAEDALNEVINEIPLDYFDYSEHYLEEIDNIEDFNRVKDEIDSFDFENQEVIYSESPFQDLIHQLSKYQIKNPFIVHGKHLKNNSEFKKFISLYKYNFSDYSPNPTLDEALMGLEVFKKSHADAIIAIGGGSCIDTAKAIKWLSKNEITKSNEVEFVDIPLITIPTTAGTGTESTRFSVIYINQEKHSLSQHSLFPDIAILNEDFLKGLPIYQRKSTLLDALCQAIESVWSINSTDLSTQYASQAIIMILDNFEEYIQGSNNNLRKIMKASHLAGRAINVTRTSAPHAMSYKLSSMYKISHGHAVALTLPYVYQKTLEIAESTGHHAVLKRLNILTQLFNSDNLSETFHLLKKIIDGFDLEVPSMSNDDLDKLTNSVNKERLSNHPVSLTNQDVKEIYVQSLKEKDQNRHLAKIAKER